VLKQAIKTILIAIGIGAVLLFIWEVWGRSGNLAGFFGMLWDWFYAITSGIVSVFRQAFSDLG
jgi:uncharacterized membrane protein